MTPAGRQQAPQPGPYRLDRAYYARARFPVHVPFQLRVSDLDTQAHVNNVSALRILEEGRGAFFREADVYGHLGGAGLMLAGLIVEYASEMHYPGTVEVFTGVRGIGRKSVTLAQMAVHEGRASLFAEVTVVTGKAGKAVEFSAGLRDALGRHLIVDPAAPAVPEGGNQT